MSAPSAPPGLSGRARRAQDKARVLREALPWMTRWRGRTIVVKYGGNVATDAPDELAAAFAADIGLLRSVGVRVVVVHGGGPQISELAAAHGLAPRFVDGQRVTDDAMLDVVRLALLGRVNPWLVGLLQGAGVTAVGVSGTDGGIVVGEPAGGGLGRVGRVAAITPDVLVSLLDDGVVPVLATLGRGPDGRDLNVNADLVAGAVAAALDADKLIYLTNVPGLYAHFGTVDSTLLSEVSLARLRAMLDDGLLATGMVPKITSIVAALDGGVPRAHLLDGRVEHALLLEIFTDEGIGTMVVGDQGEGPWTTTT